MVNLKGQLEEALQQLAKDRQQIVEALAYQMRIHFHLHYKNDSERALASEAILRVLDNRENHTTLTLSEFPVYSALADGHHEYHYNKEEVLRHFDAYLILMNIFSHATFYKNSEFLKVKKDIEQFIELVTENLKNSTIISETDNVPVPESPGSKRNKFYYYIDEAREITEEFRKAMLPLFAIERT